MNMNNCFSIGNNGPLIEETDYWESDLGLRGLCWISQNAGALRMLLPKSVEHWKEEIFTGKSVTIEPSLVYPGNIDVVFEDGTHSPFFIHMSPDAMDFDLRRFKGKKRIPFSVWTQSGMLCSFEAKVR